MSRKLLCSPDDIQPSVSLDRTELRMLRNWERQLVFPVLRVYSYATTMPWVLKLKNTKHFFFFSRKLEFSIFPSHIPYFENSAGVLSWNQPCSEAPPPWDRMLSRAGFFVPFLAFSTRPSFSILCVFPESANERVDQLFLGSSYPCLGKLLLATSAALYWVKKASWVCSGFSPCSQHVCHCSDFCILLFRFLLVLSTS